GSPYTYPSAPSIGAIGLGQHVLGTPANYQWTSLALAANQLVILQEPESENINQGADFNDSIQMGGTPPFAYQWFKNGAPVVNATNADLTVSSVLSSDAATNYYCVVTNVYGAVTSSPAILGVYSTPQFLSADPVTYTNLMTLFGGTNIDGTNYLGSSPSFSVYAGGLQPVSYFWLTNGVAVGGATSNSFTFINCQLDGPTNFSCIASNSLGTATNTWTAQYIPAPTAPYPQAIIADAPVAYWRLDETNDDQVLNENDGEVCNDFMSGNNGIYTNVALAQTPGYYVTVDGNPIITDPNETAAYFGPPLPVPGEAFSVGTNVDFSASSNAEFTVS
ncbi:MAG: immunoglobulin domain-containing protein, partial [Limisphaerales bacterium]